MRRRSGRSRRSTSISAAWSYARKPLSVPSPSKESSLTRYGPIIVIAGKLFQDFKLMTMVAAAGRGDSELHEAAEGGRPLRAL
jgi:hypothetical protein